MPCSASGPATVGSGVAMPRAARPAPSAATAMTRGMVALFAVSCGVSAANLYYAQPLLASISTGFRAGAGRTALVVTAAQVGYGLGLALLVPLGDLLVRRRLVPVLLAGAAVSLAASALAPDLAVLAAAVAVTGICSVAAQVLVPFAATLAAPERRGRVVGTVMSGLLLGILLARTVSGLVAEFAGWRTVYAVAAVVVSVLAAVLARRLPGEEARPAVRYGRLLASVVGLVRTEPLLRLRSALGALVFATFSVLWTSLAFLLAGPPYHEGEAVIGLFGLLGAAGALAAVWSGRLADRGLEPLVSGGSLVLLLAAVGLLALGGHHLVALVAGVVLADLAIQAVHIQNQQLVFALDPGARSRLNTAYMVCYFLGGAVGSATAGAAWAAAGWPGVVTLLFVYAGGATLLWAASRLAAFGRAHLRRAG